jgi:hypothetical protein
MKIISDLDSLAGAIAPAAVEWPLKLTLWNNNHLLGVEPETSVTAQPYGKADITIKDADQFARVASNIEQLKAVNEWPEGVGLHLLAPPGAEPVKSLPLQPADAAEGEAPAAAPERSRRSK